jgi:hypothetical protein
MAEARSSRPARALLALERQSDRRWFLPGVGLFPLSDYVLPFLPNQIMLAGLSMTLPRRWIALAATFAIATALGAALVTALVQRFGMALIQQVVGTMPETSAIAPVLELIKRHGLPMLVLLAMLPWPPRTAVLACAIAGLSPAQVGLAVLSGRILPSGLLAGLGARAPAVLRRIGSIDRLMEELEAERKRLIS